MVIDPWAPMLSPAQLAALGGTTTAQGTGTSVNPASQQRHGHAHGHNDAPHQQASSARQMPAEAPTASAASTSLYKTTMVADPWGSLPEDGRIDQQ